MIFKEEVTIEFNDTLIIFLWLPFLLSKDRLNHVLTHEVVIFYVKLDFIYRRNLKFRKYSLLWSLHLCLYIYFLILFFCLNVVNRFLLLVYVLFVVFHLDIFLSKAIAIKFLELDVIVLLNERIETIFDFVFRSSWKVFADLWPLATNFAIKLQNLPILFLSPIVFFDLRIKLVDKSLSDLLSILGAHNLWQKFPVFPILLNQFFDGLVFFRWPYLVSFAKLTQTSIPVQTLVLISISHERGNFRPFLGILLVKFEELIIFLGGPCLHFPFRDVLIFLPYFHVHLFAFLGVEADDELLLHSSIT